MFKHILVPTDGSPLSRAATERAISFAREAGACITFFCAVQALPKFYYGEGTIFDPESPKRFHKAAESMAKTVLEDAEKLARDAGVECATLALTSDEPHEAIIQAADRCGCDLIFMASHGRRGIQALLLGSETRKVLTFSKIPVLVHR